MPLRARRAVIGVALLLGAACSEGGGRFALPPTGVTPTPLPPPGPPPDARALFIGQTVKDDITTATNNCTWAPGGYDPVRCHTFSFTAPADGTVTASLEWDWPGTSAVLMLGIGKRELWPPDDTRPSPLSGEVQVRAGYQYDLTVGLDPDVARGTKVPYTLTTAIR